MTAIFLFLNLVIVFLVLGWGLHWIGFVFQNNYLSIVDGNSQVNLTVLGLFIPPVGAYCYVKYLMETDKKAKSDNEKIDKIEYGDTQTIIDLIEEYSNHRIVLNNPWLDRNWHSLSKIDKKEFVDKHKDKLKEIINVDSIGSFMKLMRSLE